MKAPAPMSYSIKNVRCQRYDASADATDSCLGPDWCDDCVAAIAAAVRASAIREAVERMTDAELNKLAYAMWDADYADQRRVLLGALTRREETAT